MEIPLSVFGTRYISQRDSSPLMGALSVWRVTAAQPTRPSSPSPLAEYPKASSSQPALAHSRGSSWALWWNRSRSERDLLAAPNLPPQPSTAPASTDKLPTLVASASQPIQVSGYSSFGYIVSFLSQPILPPDISRGQGRVSTSTFEIIHPSTFYAIDLSQLEDSLREDPSAHF